MSGVKHEPRSRTLTIARNGDRYFQTMLPNGDVVIRRRFARAGVKLTAEDLWQLSQRLRIGALFPDEAGGGNQP